MARRISAEEAVALAKSGDASAQYALSSVLHQRGQFDESLHWLRLAAAQKLIPAQMTLATLLMDGRHCPRDRQQAGDLLEPLAATQIQANLLLSELHGFAALESGDRETGLRYLLVAARMGEAGALRQLALLSVCHQRWDLVRPLLDAALRRGDAPAVYALARCYAEGIGGAPEPALAVRICQSDAARSQYLNQRLEQALRKLNSASSVAEPPALSVDAASLEQALPQLAADIPLPSAETLHEAPLIRRLPGAIHPLVLDTVINLAAPLVQRSQIVDARTGEVRADPMRTSSHVTLGPRQHDHVLEALERCIGRISGLAALNSEFLQILRYRPGEQFRPHVDYFNESGAGAYRSLGDGGQRAQTVLMYLNDDYSGGSTCFPKLQLDIKAQPGDMLHFHNLGADGLGHKDSLHAGLPVIAGEKWLLSQWIRSERYPARLAW
jgi:prolyl 4-hydroxylase